MNRAQTIVGWSPSIRTVAQVTEYWLERGRRGLSVAAAPRVTESLSDSAVELDGAEAVYPCDCAGMPCEDPEFCGRPVPELEVTQCPCGTALTGWGDRTDFCVSCDRFMDPADEADRGPGHYPRG